MLGVAFGAGFVLGPGDRRACRRDRSAPAVLDRGGLSLANALYGWLILPESLPPAVAHAVRLAARQSARRAQAAALASRTVRARERQLPRACSRTRCCRASACSTCVYRYGWDERTVGFVLAGVGVCSMVVQGGLIGPVVQAVRRAQRADRRPAVRRRRVLRLRRSRRPELIFLLGMPLMALWGFANPSSLGADEPPRRRRRAGPAAGREREPAGHRQHDRSRPVLAVVRAMRSGAARLDSLPGAPFLLAALMLLALARDRLAGDAGSCAACEWSHRRRKSRNFLHAIVVELAGLGEARQAQRRRSSRRSSPACRASSGPRPASRVARMRVRIGPGLNTLTRSVRGRGLGRVDARQQLERGLGDRVGAPIGAAASRRRRR